MHKSNFLWTLQNATTVFFCEMMIDIIKHSFLAKFNDIKPIAYSEFLQALCEQVWIIQLMLFHWPHKCNCCVRYCISYIHLYFSGIVRLWTFARKIERQISPLFPLHRLVWYIPLPFWPKNSIVIKEAWNDWVYFVPQVIRVLTPVYAAHLPYSPLPWRILWMAILFIITYIMLASLKVIIGMGLRKHATWYINRCRRRNSSHLHND